MALQPPAPRDLRASRRDRKLVRAVLRDAVAIGLISPAERDRRLALARSASTRGQLQALVRDLDVPEADVQQVAAVLGHVRRCGHWTVPSRLHALALLGQVELDFREARFTSDITRLWASSVFGQVTLQVPEGVRVVDDGTAVFGSRQLGQGAAATAGRVIQVGGVSIFGAVRTTPARSEPQPDRVVTVFGQVSRRGRWTVAPRLEVLCVCGQVELDFREAVFSSPEVRLVAHAVCGQVTLWVPEQVGVADRGVAVLGTRSVQEGIGAAGPVIQLEGASVMGEVQVRR